jgi:hypothetical protein
MTDQSCNTEGYSSPFISQSAPSMALILERIDSLTELTATKRRDLKSAIRSFCKLIGKHPADVVANINWLQVRIRRVAPTAHNISKKRLANIKSDVIKALTRTGCSRDRADWLRTPSPAWQALLDRIPDKHDLWKLTQLAQYCSALAVEPTAIADDHVLGLMKTLEEETFTNKPNQVAVNAVKTWNRLRDEIDGWPDIELSRPPRKREPWTIPLDQFPEQFQADVDKWLNRLAHPDPLDADGPLKPLRPDTIKHRRHQIQQMASALVLADNDIEAITSLSVLVQVDTFKVGLRQLMTRFGDKPTEAIHGLAVGITSIAAHHVKVNQDHLKELRAIGKRINLNVEGLREKNRDRLAQLDDPANMAKLLHLPEALINKSTRAGLRPHNAALLAQAAVCIEVLFYAPMRAKTLSSLSMDRHVRFIGKGRQRTAVITVPAHEVKNNRDLHHELGPASTRLLDYYLIKWRPVLLRAPSEYLFPAQNGGPKRKEHVSGLIKATIMEHTGLVIHTHLFRNIAAKVHSMAAPGDFVTLSHVLHNTLKTAMKNYAQFEHRSSIRHYQNSVDEARKRLTPSRSKKKAKPS